MTKFQAQLWICCPPPTCPVISAHWYHLFKPSWLRSKGLKVTSDAFLLAPLKYIQSARLDSMCIFKPFLDIQDFSPTSDCPNLRPSYTLPRMLHQLSTQTPCLYFCLPTAPHNSQNGMFVCVFLNINQTTLLLCLYPITQNKFMVFRYINKAYMVWNLLTSPNSPPVTPLPPFTDLSISQTHQAVSCLKHPSLSQIFVNSLLNYHLLREAFLGHLT